MLFKESEIRKQIIQKAHSLPALNLQQKAVKNYSSKKILKKDMMVSQYSQKILENKLYASKKQILTPNYAISLKSGNYNTQYQKSQYRPRKNNDKFYLKDDRQGFRFKDKLKFVAKSQSTNNKPKQGKNLQSLIDKPKISSNCTKNIIAYGINSHSGSFNIINEDRICVSLSLKKNNRDYQASLFGIFSGKHGVIKAEYFRDNYHKILSNDSLLFNQTKKALIRSYRTVQTMYDQDQISHGDYSKVSFIITLIIRNKQTNKGAIYICQLGQCKSLYSFDLGSRIQKPNSLKIQQMQEIEGYSSIHDYRKKKKENVKNPLIEVIESTSDIDFIVLGSQAIFHKKKQEQIGRQIWRYLISMQGHQSRIQSQGSYINMGCDISERIGIAINRNITHSLMNQAPGNLSMIIIAFQSLRNSFEDQAAKIQIPFVCDNISREQQMDDEINT